jgi:hypothetical protein
MTRITSRTRTTARAKNRAGLTVTRLEDRVTPGSMLLSGLDLSPLGDLLPRTETANELLNVLSEGRTQRGVQVHAVAAAANQAAVGEAATEGHVSQARDAGGHDAAGPQWVGQSPSADTAARPPSEWTADFLAGVFESSARRRAPAPVRETETGSEAPHSLVEGSIMGPAQLAAGGAARAISPEVFGGARQATLALAASQRGATTVGSPPGSPNNEQALSDLGQQPLSFEANRGQAGPGIDFVARAAGYSVSLTATEAVLALQSAQGRPATGESSTGASTGGNATAGARGAADAAPPAVVRMQIVGGNPTPAPTGMDELPGKVNYFIGNDPSRWHADVPTYAGVQYHSVYPGIDLVYHGNQGQMEYDFVVAPGADAGRVVLNFAGADHVSVDGHGDLVVEAGGGQIRETRPVVYQEVDGVRREVAGGYVLDGGQQVSFQVGAYDPSRALVIDPVTTIGIVHCSQEGKNVCIPNHYPFTQYLGGAAYDSGDAIAVDAYGDTVVTGETDSDDFPASHQFGGDGYPDAYVCKYSVAGYSPLYCTYLGGEGNDRAFGIALDTADNVYVTGITNSSNFPTTGTAFQPTHQGGNDAFVTKLNSTGNSLVYSTYFGGRLGDDGAWRIALDSNRDVYVTGSTASTDFPFKNFLNIQNPPYSGATLHGPSDAFVTKLNPALAGDASLVYSSYLGGGGDETGYGIAVDSAGSAYVSGSTGSSNFPVKNPLNIQNPLYSGATLHGTTDAFAIKLSPDGQSLAYSTYLGGGANEEARSLALDSAGSVYVFGWSSSADFPVKNPLSGGGYSGATLHGPSDAFVTKLSPDGQSLAYSTYLGGSSDEYGAAIAVDADGNAYVTGETHSTDFPVFNVSNDYQNPGGNGDAYVTKLSAAGSALVGSGYLGGTEEDAGYGIATGDINGGVPKAYVTGSTASDDFPTVAGSPPFGGFYDAFVAKLGGPAGVG